MLFKKYNALENAKKEIGDIITHLNSTTLCFTGHRTQKLPWRFNEADPRCVAMKETLYNELLTSINEGYNTFLSGMALGFDILCVEVLLKLKKTYKDIKIIGIIPCKTQDKLWKDEQKKKYKDLLNKIDGVRCIYDDYIGSECMLERNRYMVNHSSKMIALFNGLPGGTKSTIDYAKKQGLNVTIIKP